MQNELNKDRSKFITMLPHSKSLCKSNMNTEPNITTFFSVHFVIYTNNGNIQFKCTGFTCGRENTAPWLIVLLQFRNYRNINFCHFY